MKNVPMRVIEGTAKPHEAFWKLRNQAETGGEPEIEFYGVISEFSWFEDDITPKMFKSDLYKLGGGGPVTVRMNSGGGEVFAASVIKSIMVEYPGRVTVLIDGLAASAATIVAMGGDVIKIQESAYFMIHDPWTVTWGTIEEIKAVLDMLKTIKAGIVDAYQTRTKLAVEKISKMMTDETWLTGREAKDLGFVDEVISGAGTVKKGLQNTTGVLNCLNRYGKVPDAVLERWLNGDIYMDRQDEQDGDPSHGTPTNSAPAQDDNGHVDGGASPTLHNDGEYQREVERLRCEVKMVI